MPRILLLLAAFSCSAGVNGAAEDGGELAARETDDEQVSVGAPLPRPPTVALQPLNGATDVLREADNTSPYEAPTGPAILGSGYTRPIDRALLEQVARGARMVSEATHEEVELGFVYGTRGEPRLGLSYVKLVPKRALAEGWYALEVPKPDPPLVWPEQPDIAFELLQTGTARTRFHVGSAPYVREISVCDKADGRTAIDLRTSEVVEAREPMAEHIYVESNGERVSCTPSASPGSLRVLCQLADVAVLQIVMSDAFTSLADPTLPISSATKTLEIDLRAGKAHGEYCRRFPAE